MTTAQEIITTHEVLLSSTTKTLGDVPADALVVGVDHDGALAVTGEVKSSVRRRLDALAQRAQASGSVEKVTVVPAPDEVRADLVVFTGLGRDEGPQRLENLRLAAGSATRALQGRAATAVVALPVLAEDEVQAVAEGVGLGAFEYTVQKTTEDEHAPLREAFVSVPKNLAKAAKGALTRASHVTRAVRLTRTLVDLSPDTATPEFVADVAATAVRSATPSPASASASPMTPPMRSTCSRLASSAITPPYCAWTVCDQTRLARTATPPPAPPAPGNSSTMPTPVSSQEVSMPRIKRVIRAVYPRPPRRSATPAQ